MAGKLEAGAVDGAEYYMVTVSESVSFSYPVLATDAEAAREKVAALALRPVGVFGDRGEQQFLELEHLWDLPPVEHAAHQNEERKRVLLERFDRAVGDEVEHLLRAKRREQDARVALDDAQRRVVVFGKTVEFERMQILPMRFVPLAISIMVNCLPPRSIVWNVRSAQSFIMWWKRNVTPSGSA